MALFIHVIIISIVVCLFVCGCVLFLILVFFGEGSENKKDGKF